MLPHLELVHSLELELLRVLERAHCGKVFHASVEAQRVVEQDESPHASLPTRVKGQEKRVWSPAVVWGI